MKKAKQNILAQAHSLLISTISHLFLNHSRQSTSLKPSPPSNPNPCGSSLPLPNPAPQGCSLNRPSRLPAQASPSRPAVHLIISSSPILQARTSVLACAVSWRAGIP
ncbi:unnamed protein product [Urochloa humidicola]